MFRIVDDYASVVEDVLICGLILFSRNYSRERTNGWWYRWGWKCQSGPAISFGEALKGLETTIFYYYYSHELSKGDQKDDENLLSLILKIQIWFKKEAINTSQNCKIFQINNWIYSHFFCFVNILQ